MAKGYLTKLYKTHFIQNNSHTQALSESSIQVSEESNSSDSVAMAQPSSSSVVEALRSRRKSKLDKSSLISKKWRDSVIHLGSEYDRQMASFEDELFNYTSFPTFESSDPLEFYRKYSKQFPMLTNLVRRLFCIPATSVPAECLFSKAGIIQSELRNRLNPDLLEYYCFLSHNQTL